MKMILLLLFNLFLLFASAHAQDNNLMKEKLFYLDQADIYADSSSESYNPEKARYYYFRTWGGEFSSLFIAENCLKIFLNIPPEIVNNDIHQTVISTFQNFCTLSNKDLFSVAQDFEKDGGLFLKDKKMAFAIYEHLRSRFAMIDDQRELAKAVREKMQLLRKQE